MPNRFKQHYKRRYTGRGLGLNGDDGNYYFHGRRDGMIRVGHRIELGEIECALLSHPVAKRPPRSAPDIVGSRIMAVVSTHGAQTLNPVDLQSHCAMRIPQYMIPETVEFMHDLPKTSSGKIDRVRLAQSANLESTESNGQPE